MNPFQSKILNSFTHLFQWYSHFFSLWQHPFVLVLRLLFGYRLMTIGYGKLMDPTATAAAFASLGIPLSETTAFLVGFFETLGGFLLLIGFMARLAALPIAIIMLTAFGTAHRHIFLEFAYLIKPETIAQEAPFGFLMTALIVLFFGPGKYSVDHWLEKKIDRLSTIAKKE